MQMYLTLDGLWQCIESSSTIDTEKDKKALARICLAVKPCCLQHIRNAKTAKDAWVSLCNVYENKGFYRRVMLLRKLHRIQLSDFVCMSAYIDGLMTLVQQLADIGRTIEDAEVAELMLSGLPMEYDILVSGLETANVNGNLTSELVRTPLL